MELVEAGEDENVNGHWLQQWEKKGNVTCIKI